MATDPRSARVISSEPLDPSDARWIRLQKITYEDPTGKQRTWESAERKTRPPPPPPSSSSQSPTSTPSVDGVGILAILSRPSGPHLLLQKQFRPALDRVVIEVPSGLIDAGESAEDCAVRELREETGYVGVCTGTEASKEAGGLGLGSSFTMFNDPGFTNTNTVMVEVFVDAGNERNKVDGGGQMLEEGEFIECFEVPLQGLWGELGRLEKEEGLAVDARVGTFAMGLEVARRIGGGYGMGEKKGE